MKIALSRKSPMVFTQLKLLTMQLVCSFTYQQTGYWEATDCSGAPFYMDIFPEFNCGQRNITYNCSPYTFNGTEYYRTVICVEDTHMWTWSYFQSMPYVMMEQYESSEADCGEYVEGRVVVASDNCVKMINSTSYQSAIASMGDLGSESLQLFMDDECASTPGKNFSIESSLVANHSCYDNEYKFYSQSEYTSTDAGSASGSASSGEGLVNPSSGSFGSSDVGTSSNSTSSSSSEVSIETSTNSGPDAVAYVGIGIAALVMVACTAWLIYWWGRRSATRKHEATVDGDYMSGGAAPATETSPASGFTSEASGDGAALWRDEIILGARVPFEKVVVKRLIARGGYGEVYVGSYNGKRVAVKRLLPETRKSKAHRITLLAEIKMMAVLEHPHIVQLVGVAWDSPNDLCALTDFMDGGDLRALLNKHEKDNRPTGFSPEKIKIALHVAHALAYLHSLDPPVIHRDLKSRNILLTQTRNAKLTDFGISRERVDRTMTAEVGTSLWMAPEVMMGQRYNDQADIFSFGVVLSELNTHAMPYTHARFQDGPSERLPDTAILQLVAAGKLHADFTRGSPESLLRLGLACVALDPKVRPSTTEVLYQLQKIMREMPSKQ